ncbi:MAG: CHASE domain-containing protein [Granulosicoccus sp.]
MTQKNIRTFFDGFSTFEKIAAGLVLFTGLVLTFLAYNLVSNAQQQRFSDAFEQKASDTATSLSNTLTRHTNLLIGLQALFHSAQNTSRRQFADYVTSIDRERNHPEAAAISWNALVPFNDMDAFKKSVREDTSLVAQGYPDFEIKPPLEQGKSGIVVTYMEPFKGNENAFGFDIGSNPARRAAALEARDTGNVAITEPIVLTQDSGSTQKAFLMLLPTYSTLNLDNEQARRLAYNGQVVVVTRAAQLIQKTGTPDVDFFQVVDNTEGQSTSLEERLLHSIGNLMTQQDVLQTERELSIGGRTWQLFFQESLSQQPLADRAIEITVLGLGGLVSVLASMLFGSLASSKHSAELQAEKLTVDLKLANEELTRSNNDLSQFAHVASHDLQTPVRNVISTVTLLEDHLGDSADPEVIELFGYLKNSSVRMRTLVSDLLNYARLGRDAISFEPVDLNSVLDEVKDSTRELCEDSGTILSVSPLPTIAGDARQLNRVFENLIINAIKYSHPERLPEIEISERKDEAESVYIVVSDNGQGIKEEYRDTVFLPFKRLHRHDEIPGTGLGLGICKQIVERHGGNITIESSSSAGTTFLLVLPVSEQASNSA